MVLVAVIMVLMLKPQADTKPLTNPSTLDIGIGDAARTFRHNSLLIYLTIGRWGIS